MKRVFDFMKSRGVMLIISALVIVGGIAGTVARGGFNLGIDFEAGLNLTVSMTGSGVDADVADVREVLSEYESAQIQRLGDAADNEFVIRVRDDGTVEDFEQVVSADILQELRSGFPDARIQELQASYVGPRFSEDLTRQAVVLTVFALLLILAYLWFRFRLGYALASISALLHDVLIILGVIGTFQLEVSTATIAAVLTIIGYSLNDTIVIFDRIRENETLLRESSFRTVINTSISQSLSRTLITSLTTLLAVTAIFVFSTGQIELFALKLIIGVIVGTYSSVFVASPVLLTWHTRALARRKRKDLEKYHKGAVGKSGETSGSSGTAAATTAQTAAAAADVEATKRAIAAQRSKKKGKKSR
ncbi:MAG: protein translocase subunit SecF [Spirochaeta sp.]|jgi:preprotein translocase subunit SecF|nr:protein translocase subunit SecF [Spirochaeta sp.]